AIKRGAPARVPEVLVGRVDIPGRRQFERGCSSGPSEAERTAVHGVTHDAEACAVARVVYGPARLRGLEDVSQRALGVVDLRLEVVALPAAKPVEEPWRIQLETGADHPAELLIRMTADQAPHRAAIAGIVDRIDLMQGAHDLGRTPS